jgi:hypothetical protein
MWFGDQHSRADSGDYQLAFHKLSLGKLTLQEL